MSSARLFCRELLFHTIAIIPHHAAQIPFIPVPLHRSPAQPHHSLKVNPPRKSDDPEKNRGYGNTTRFITAAEILKLLFNQEKCGSLQSRTTELGGNRRVSDVLVSSKTGKIKLCIKGNRNTVIYLSRLRSGFRIMKILTVAN